jgi:hypothetical protein
VIAPENETGSCFARQAAHENVTQQPITFQVENVGFQFLSLRQQATTLLDDVGAVHRSEIFPLMSVQGQKRRPV